MGEPWLGWIVWAGFGGWRLVEVAWARANLRRLLDRGGHVLPRDCLGVMVVLHVATMAGSAVERLLGAEVGGAVSWAAGAVLVLALTGRVWMHATLGRRWTVRVVVLPGEEPIRHGPYRLLRHPNYWIVLLEVLALPAFLHAWWTLALGTLPHAAVLAVRIRREERAWRETAGAL